MAKRTGELGLTLNQIWPLVTMLHPSPQDHQGLQKSLPPPHQGPLGIWGLWSFMLRKQFLKLWNLSSGRAIFSGAKIAASTVPGFCPGQSEPVCLREHCFPCGSLAHDARQLFFHPPLSQVPSDPYMLCNRASLIKQEQALPWRVCYSWNLPSPSLDPRVHPQVPVPSRCPGPMPSDLHVPRM